MFNNLPMTNDCTAIKPEIKYYVLCLMSYFKLASNTIELIEGRTRTDATGGKRQRSASSNDPSAQSGSGSGPGSGSGLGEGSAPKRPRTFSKNAHTSGNTHVSQAHYSDGGGDGGPRTGSRSRYDSRYDSGGYYGSCSYRQRRKEHDGTPKTHHYGPRGDFREGGSKVADPTAAADAAAIEHPAKVKKR